MATSQPQRRRPPSDSFRPALRFPTDPHMPDSLPSKIHQIVGTPNPSLLPVQSPSAASTASSAANLLQSRRKPWELDLNRLEELYRKGENERKVVLVLGDVPQTSLQPLITSKLLRSSLIIIVTAFESHLNISSKDCLPTIRILRLRPSKRSPPKAQSPASSSSSPEPLTAFRVTSIIEWAEQVANSWRSSHARNQHQQQPKFAVLNEGENGNGISGYGGKGRTKTSSSFASSSEDGQNAVSTTTPWMRKPKSTSSLRSEETEGLPTRGFIVDVGDNPATPPGSPGRGSARRRPPMAGASTSTSTLASIPDVTDDSGQQDLFTNDVDQAKVNGGGTSPYGAPIPREPTTTKLSKSGTVKKRKSIFGRVKPGTSFGVTSESMPTSPTTTSHASSPSSKPSPQPAFSAIINFLPSPSSSHSSTALHSNQGQIASQHAQSQHSKVLLRETILITTLAQRFLLPFRPSSSLSAANRWSEAEVERGMFTKGDAYSGSVRMRAIEVGGRSVAVAAASRSAVEIRHGQTSSEKSKKSSTEKRKSLGVARRLSGLFGSSTPTPPSLPPPLPTPPDSRTSTSSSERDEAGSNASVGGVGPSAWRRPSASISSHSSPPSTSTSKSSTSKPKLIQVLPFENAQGSFPAAPHLMNNMNAGTARLVRNLEAFLLSWSFGGGKNPLGDVGAGSGSEDEANNALQRGLMMDKKGGHVRPFLLDLSGLSDGLSMPSSSPPPSAWWSVIEIILSGAIDDEYSCTRVSTPPLTRTNSDRLMVPSSSGSIIVTSPPSTSSRPGTSQSLPTNLANDDVSWATRRAWIGSVEDIALYRLPPRGESGALLVRRARHQSLRMSLNGTPPLDLSSYPPVPTPTTNFTPSSTPTPSLSASSSSSSSISGMIPPMRAQTSPAVVQQVLPAEVALGSSSPLIKVGDHDFETQEEQNHDKRPISVSSIDVEPSSSAVIPETDQPTLTPTPTPTPAPTDTKNRILRQSYPTSISSSPPLQTLPLKALPTPPSSLRHNVPPSESLSQRPLSTGPGHVRRLSEGVVGVGVGHHSGPVAPLRPLSVIAAATASPSPLRNAVVLPTSPPPPKSKSKSRSRPNSPPIDKALPPPPPPPPSQNKSALPTPPDSASSSSAASNHTAASDSTHSATKVGGKKRWWNAPGVKLLKIL